MNISITAHSKQFFHKLSSPLFWMRLGVFVAIVVFCLIENHIVSKPPSVWWGWLNQGRYLDASKTFALNNWPAIHHWYPPGYALLSTSFVNLFTKDPCVVVDLLSLIAALVAIARIAVFLDLPATVGLVIVLLTSAMNISLLPRYTLPWTSTPLSSLILWGLYLAILPPRPMRSLLLGVIMGGILLIKPTDDIALIPVGIYYLAQLLRPQGGAFSWKSCGKNILAGFAAIIFFAAIAVIVHYKIYNWHLSDYEAMREGQVFLADQWATKFYSLFVNPYILNKSFHQPVGLFWKFPWLIFGLCGMITASARKMSYAALSLSILLYMTLYAVYFDPAPHNLWPYKTLHYFIWTLPILGLFCCYLFKRFVSGQAWHAVLVTVAVGFLLLAAHPQPRPVALADADSTTNPTQQTTVKVDLSTCVVPCRVNLEITNKTLDEELIRDATFDPLTRHAIRTLSWLIFPNEHGLDILILKGAGIHESELTFPGPDHLDMQKVEISNIP